MHRLSGIRLWDYKPENLESKSKQEVIMEGSSKKGNGPRGAILPDMMIVYHYTLLTFQHIDTYWNILMYLLRFVQRAQTLRLTRTDTSSSIVLRLLFTQHVQTPPRSLPDLLRATCSDSTLSSSNTPRLLPIFAQYAQTPPYLRPIRPDSSLSSPNTPRLLPFFAQYAQTPLFAQHAQTSSSLHPTRPDFLLSSPNTPRLLSSPNMPRLFLSSPNTPRLLISSSNTPRLLLTLAQQAQTPSHVARLGTFSSCNMVRYFLRLTRPDTSFAEPNPTQTPPSRSPLRLLLRAAHSDSSFAQPTQTPPSRSPLRLLLRAAHSDSSFAQPTQTPPSRSPLRLLLRAAHSDSSFAQPTQTPPSRSPLRLLLRAAHSDSSFAQPTRADQTPSRSPLRLLLRAAHPDSSFAQPTQTPPSRSPPRLLLRAAHPDSSFAQPTQTPPSRSPPRLLLRAARPDLHRATCSDSSFSSYNTPRLPFTHAQTPPCACPGTSSSRNTSRHFVLSV
ncbi:hypothetical protein TNCV_381651 [Trichonephila clavipes]|uniref:Uncharacterized protein n=1 Tax=Trichonephila clavipes TaxID=2585209 RepID=A0A8X6SAQ8_TRICX|nr:hypothetical protein TNCV_381651 [Trichonephila clavipes]